MMNGYILLHRKIKDNWIFQNSNYFHWFVILLFEANFTTKDNYLFNGNFITIERGSFITSYEKLSKICPNSSFQKIRTFLKLLEKDNIIKTKNIIKATKITICNYDTYQSVQQPTNNQLTTKQQPTNNQLTTIERKNKERLIKDNKENNKSSAILNFKNFNFSENSKQKIKDFIDYRKEIKKPFKSQKSIAALLSTASKHTEREILNCINNSISNGWQGLFWDKASQNEKPKILQNGLSYDSDFD